MRALSIWAASYVRFGSKADMCIGKNHVRFPPNSDRESDFSQKSMSALTPKRTCAAQSGMSAKGQKQICIEGKPGLSKSKEPGRLAGLLLSHVSTKGKSIVVTVPVLLNDHDLGIVIAPVIVIAPSIVMTACPPTMKAAIVIAVSRDNHCSILRVCGYGW
jgi:hypothetical protein